MYDDDIPYTETVNYLGDQGHFLAPDECRVCWRDRNQLVQNCTEHP